jgi:hypothetical protein
MNGRATTRRELGAIETADRFKFNIHGLLG